MIQALCPLLCLTCLGKSLYIYIYICQNWYAVISYLPHQVMPIHNVMYIFNNSTTYIIYILGEICVGTQSSLVIFFLTKCTPAYDCVFVKIVMFTSHPVILTLVRSY